MIELLVVILIIGILAGIALPQYKKAVMMSRAQRWVPLLRTIGAAQEAFFLANNRYARSFSELDVAATAKYEERDCEHAYKCLTLNDSGDEIILNPVAGYAGEMVYWLNTQSTPDLMMTYVYKEGLQCRASQGWNGRPTEGSWGRQIAKNVCKSLSGRENSSAAAWGWEYFPYKK